MPAQMHRGAVAHFAVEERSLSLTGAHAYPRGRHGDGCRSLGLDPKAPTSPSALLVAASAAKVRDESSQPSNLRMHDRVWKPACQESGTASIEGRRKRRK